MNKPLAVLIIEDSASDAELIARQLRKAGYDLLNKQVDTAAQMRQALQQQHWDIVISDYNLPQFNGKEALEIFQEMGLDIPFIVVSGEIGEETAVAMMKAGAHDYLLKDKLARLTPAVERELAQAEIRRRRKQAESDLIHSEQRYRDLFNTMLDGFYRSTPDGRLIDINPAMAKMFGYENREDMLKVDVVQDLYFDPADRHSPILDNNQQGPEIYRMRRKDGSEIWVEDHGYYIRDEKGQTIFHEGILRDVTRRKQAEQELGKSRALFRSLVESMPHNVFSKDLEGRFTFANQQHCKTDNRTLEEFIGKTDFDIYPAELARQYRADDLHVMQTGQVLEKEEIHQALEGQKSYVQVVKAPVYSDDRQVSGMVGIFWDITERKRIENALRESENLYRKMNQNSPLGMHFYKLDKEGRLLLVDANPAADQLLGIEHATLFGKTIQEAFPNLETTDIPKHYREAAANGMTWSTEYIAYQDEQITGAFEVRAFQTAPNNMVAVFANITARKQAEKTQAEFLERTRRQQENIVAMALHPAFSAGSIREAIQFLTSSVSKTINLARVSVWLKEDNSNAMRCHGLYSRESNTHVRGKLLSAKDFPAYFDALETGRAIDAHEALTDPRTCELSESYLKPSRITSILDAAIRISGQIVGIVCLEHTGNPRTWQTDEITFAGEVADQMAQVLTNAERKQNAEALEIAYDATLMGWSNALELREHETAGHSRRIVKMTLKLARMMGIPEEQIIHIQRGTLLHDIGKMGIPDHILLKPGPLTEEEWVVMRQHPEFSHRMLAGIDYLKPALDIPCFHHERWDGTGYPYGLKGEQIPLAARIFAVIDVWDALSFNRPYRPAWPQHEVIKYLVEQSGQLFDPQVVKNFIEILPTKPAGRS